MTVKRLGVVLERKEDALKTGRPLDHLYHWREPEEIDAIVSALRSLGYSVELLGTPEDLLANLQRCRSEVDFIINLSVGFISRFRLAAGPALFQLAGIPHWGADPYSRLVSQNKHLAKSFMDHLGLPTPPWRYLHQGDNPATTAALGFPLMVKPACEGSSIGIGPDAVVQDGMQLQQRVHAIHHDLDMPVIVERFIQGREVKIGIVGHERPRFVGIIEDTLSDGAPLGQEFLYFRAKKAGMLGKQPRDAQAPEFAKLLADCRRAYHLLLPLDYATFDVRIDPAGQHFFLEVNADATLHPARTLAQCAALNGLSYAGLLAAILETALER